MTADTTGEDRYGGLTAGEDPYRHVCRNQGTALAEKPCGFCHEGPCDRDMFVVLRRTDVQALLEEWSDLDSDPFWRPVEGSDSVVFGDDVARLLDERADLLAAVERLTAERDVAVGLVSEFVASEHTYSTECKETTNGLGEPLCHDHEMPWPCAVGTGAALLAALSGGGDGD